MVEIEQQLQSAVREACGLLQQISDFIKDNPQYREAAHVRFPRDFLEPSVRTAKSWISLMTAHSEAMSRSR
jgi:hypothetical protein